MRKIKIINLLVIFTLLLNISDILSQNKINSSKLYSEFALKKSRDQYKEELDKKIKNVFIQELNSLNEDEWKSLFREVGLIYYRTNDVFNAIEKAIAYSSVASIKFKRALIETILILYPNRFTDFINTISQTTNDPTLFAYTTNAKLRNNDSLTIRKKYSLELRSRFPNWENIPQLKFLDYYLLHSETKTPDLKELFTHPFMAGKTIIYSLQRKNRRYPGITIIKKPDGTFVKEKNGSIFYVKQLAISVSELPGYLSQGNTPQGIFSVVGFYVSPTPSIGPTAAVLTRIPFEVPTKLFYHGAVIDRMWKLEDYKNLLPDSWKDYLPIYESYYAGMTGRRKIVMHGSVDDLSFYKGLPYFPLTPSKGCLTTTEIWSEDTGRNIKSDQARLMNAFFSTGELEGFLIVVDINDKQKDVTIDEILPFLN